VLLAVTAVLGWQGPPRRAATGPVPGGGDAIEFVMQCSQAGGAAALDPVEIARVMVTGAKYPRASDAVDARVGGEEEPS